MEFLKQTNECTASCVVRLINSQCKEKKHLKSFQIETFLYFYTCKTITI